MPCPDAVPPLRQDAHRAGVPTGQSHGSLLLRELRLAAPKVGAQEEETVDPACVDTKQAEEGEVQHCGLPDILPGEPLLPGRRLPHIPRQQDHAARPAAHTGHLAVLCRLWIIGLFNRQGCGSETIKYRLGINLIFRPAVSLMRGINFLFLPSL